MEMYNKCEDREKNTPVETIQKQVKYLKLKFSLYKYDITSLNRKYLFTF